MSQETSARGPILCQGHPLVDLICERPAASLGEAGAFVPHFGGVVANIAVAAARGGAPVALVGAAGDDEWGAWLKARLQQERVDVSWFGLLAGRQTPVALVTVDPDGEPSYRLYGTEPAGLAEVLSEPELERVGALLLSTNTMVEASERELTMRLRSQALAESVPIVFDPNLRLHRWRSRTDAAATANACVPGALLVRCNAAEAAVMTGEEDAERAAMALVKAGARLVVISRGAQGAILRGEMRAEVPGCPGPVRSTVGAGDMLTGHLLAALASTGFYPASVAAGLPGAVARATEACGRWGALD